MGLFKRKLTIQKRAEQKKFEQRSENQNFDDYVQEEYENRNPFFDIVGFLCLLFAGILLLSYFSMNMEDLNSNNEIKNLLGIFGAYISSYSFLAFGFASYVIPAFFIYAGVNIILKNSTDRILISALSSSILMILLSILLNIFLGSLDFYNKGGMLGEFIGGSLVSIFGKTGAVMIVIAGLVITAIVFAKLSIMDLVNYFRNMVRNVDFEKIKDIEQKVVNGIKDLEIKKKTLGHLIIDQIYTKKNKFEVFGKLDQKFIPRKDFNIISNGEKIEIKYYELTNDYNEETFSGENLHDYIGINFVLPLNKNWDLGFYIKNEYLMPRFKRSSIFTEFLFRSYHHEKNRTIVLKGNKLYNQKRNVLKSFYYELRNEMNLIKRRRYKAWLARITTKIMRLFKRKEIWLISDRVNKADDNGEHFFKYMIENHPEVKTYFILTKDSPDYQRLSSWKGKNSYEC